jgi:N-acetylglucosamine kinase-like BadF-type ATPase
MIGKLFLGVDGGKSSTTALVGDETGRVLSVGRGGPCNHVEAAGGRERLISAITECITAACDGAGVKPAGVRFASAALGFTAGPADKQEIISEILHCDRLTITNDAHIALAGAFAGEAGIVTIAGTGSVSYGKNDAGETALAGGWGYVFGDEAGAFDLTRQALRAALRYEEGWGPPTVLRARLLDVTGIGNAYALVRKFYSVEFPVSRIAGYAKLLDEAAKEGDSVAREILENAASQLATLTAAVRQRLFGEKEVVRVAHIGGVFHSNLILERFRALVKSSGGKTMPPMYGPAAGALLEAYRTAGLKPQLRCVPEAEK